MAKENTLGLSRNDYKGRKSTLCPGCGHDSISNQIISTAYDLGLEQHKVIKMSGIGCSSKTPAYFLGRSHGFNALHGRMPSVATGALLANRELKAVAVSGDGDTGSIGMGQFKHVIRRNVPFVYIIENNGVYGLTKGQFSATADEGQELKYYGRNDLPAIDLALEAIISGATFVARSFSGDAKQVQSLLQAAIAHKGTAILDIISPCVTFNNNDSSTKSYSYGKEHEIPLHEIQVLAPDYVEGKEEITIGDYAEGEIIEVDMHDGTIVRLKKLDRDHDPRNRMQAISVLEEAQREQLFLTGLIYYEEPRPTVQENENLIEAPLATISEAAMRPSAEKLAEVMASFR
ncbi:MAG: 2-oxoacid:ferredoxin oxidoreductase subunit beta [Anaerolineae bacterium]|nr:2-oxoacid:ferredoxin oxidoreductase subunit beta [Anaerolineae bacterium]MCA9887835.1 2-oxoacid:ferredoxin oxidoreductase subunit beta [Anaerolineae bacterium]MCA9893363.1 2-oxoacid:ferredoxin oxidoreductase subunit beta [Anaerolineae bacterium]MCB9461918.1 2-oxoacid:ferredoxin oxidoreductase subunit beta [Anaerolineaceae bacterium]